MNATTIIDIPPRIIRPATGRNIPKPPASARTYGGDDELNRLARQIVQHDPALALLLARAGDRALRS